MPRTLRRAARLLVIALVVGVGISQVILTLSDWHLSDADAYWDAALRLRASEPLYPELADADASNVYRYAPWFAWAWVPITYLPKAMAYAAWSAVLLAASGVALAPLVRRRAWLAVAFFLPVLIGISGIGNVQPLLVAALVAGAGRASGPIWIGAAASLKVVPILLAVTYLGRREWGKFVATGLVAAALVAPMLLYDLSSYPTGANAAAFLIVWPPAYALAVAGGILVSVRLAETRWSWLTSSTTAALALPRFFVYDVTFLMAAFTEPRSGTRSDRSAT